MAESLARQSALNFVAGVSTTLGGFLSTMLVARLLGVEGTGIVAFATWVVTVAIVVADLGLSGALTRFLPELRARGDLEAASGLTSYLLRRQLTVLAILVACFAALVGAAAEVVPTLLPVHGGSYVHTPLFWAIVGAACLTQSLASFVLGYLKGTEDFRKLAVVAAIGGGLQIATTLVGSLLFGVAGAMTAAVLGHVATASLIVTTKARSGSIGAEMKKRVNRFALGSWATYIVTAFAWSRMELFFLQRSWGSEATGLFSVSLTLANLVTQAPLLLTGALLPYMARHAGVDSAHKAKEAYGFSMRLMAFIIFPACFGAAAIAPRLLPLLFGADFTPAVPTAVVLVSTAGFSAVASVAVTYLFAVERTSIVFATGVLGAALSVGVGVFLVPLYGPIAAAAGRGGIQILIVAVAVLYIDQRLGCPAPYGAVARLIAAAALCGLAASLAISFIPGMAGLACAIVVGAACYFLAVKILRALPAEDLQRLVTAARAILPGWLSRRFEALRLLG